MRLAGRVALVIGGSSGIGRACVDALAADGAAVVVADVDDAGGEQAVADVTAAGGKAAFVHTTIMEEAVRRRQRALRRRHLRRPQHPGHERRRPAAGGAPRYARRLEVHGRHVPDRAVLRQSPGAAGDHRERQRIGDPHRLDRRHPRLAHRRRRHHRVPDRQARRRRADEEPGAALRPARAFGSNAICPGYIKTQATKQLYEADTDGSYVRDTLRVPLQRWGRPEEIGTVAAFLASDEASFISGQVIVADGGMTAR